MNNFTVYQLIDPRDGKPFYVGCTRAPASRARAHRSGARGTSIYPRIREIKSCGLVPIFEVVKSGLNKIQALWLEREMIYDTPGLLNRPSGRLSEVFFPRRLGSAEAAYAYFEKSDSEYVRNYLNGW
jgi:hypothetical protein